MKRGKHYRTLRALGPGQRVKGHMYKGNPGGLLGLIGNPMRKLTDNIEHPLHKDVGMEMLTGALGAYLTKAIPTRRWISGLTDKIPMVGNFVNLLVGNGLNMTAVASAAKLVPVKQVKNASKGLLVGGVVITGYELLNMIMARISPNMVQSTMSGLGANSATRKAIQEKVMKQLQANKFGQPKADSSFAQTAMGKIRADSAYLPAMGSPAADSSYATIGGLMETGL